MSYIMGWGRMVEPGTFPGVCSNREARNFLEVDKRYKQVALPLDAVVWVCSASMHKKRGATAYVVHLIGGRMCQVPASAVVEASEQEAQAYYPDGWGLDDSVGDALPAIAPTAPNLAALALSAVSTASSVAFLRR